MEHDFSVCSTGKFPEKSGTSEKVVPFSRWKFSDGTACSIYGFSQRFTSSRPLTTISSRLLPQLARWLPSPPLSTNAQSVKAWLLIRKLETLPVACTSPHRASKVPRVILKWLLNSSIVAIDRKLICKQNILIKTFISASDGASYKLQRPPGKECHHHLN